MHALHPHPFSGAKNIPLTLCTGSTCYVACSLEPFSKVASFKVADRGVKRLDTALVRGHVECGTNNVCNAALACCCSPSIGHVLGALLQNKR